MTAQKFCLHDPLMCLSFPCPLLFLVLAFSKGVEFLFLFSHSTVLFLFKYRIPPSSPIHPSIHNLIALHQSTFLTYCMVVCRNWATVCNDSRTWRECWREERYKPSLNSSLSRFYTLHTNDGFSMLWLHSVISICTHETFSPSLEKCAFTALQT